MLGNVVRISNEVEFGLKGVDADVLIETALERGLDVVNEVNRKRMVELNISKANSVAELNQRLIEDVQELKTIASTLGGTLLFTSYLHNADHDPITYYRTTALSCALADGLRRVLSFQVVVGFDSERLGIMFYNTMRELLPLLISRYANNPIIYDDYLMHAFEYFVSRDMSMSSDSIRHSVVYPYMLRKLPPSMYVAPVLYSLEHYYEVLAKVSADVLDMLHSIDVNWEQFARFSDFELLEPHQVYWPVRLRPDHRDSDTLFTVEVRGIDAQPTVESMIELNNTVVGVAYLLERSRDLCEIYSMLASNRGVLHGV